MKLGLVLPNVQSIDLNKLWPIDIAAAVVAGTGGYLGSRLLGRYGAFAGAAAGVITVAFLWRAYVGSRQQLLAKPLSGPSFPKEAFDRIKTIA